MNAEPLIPLPKVRINEAFSADQLIMLWLIWACGITLGTIVFLFERMTTLKAKDAREKHSNIEVNKGQENTRAKQLRERTREAMMQDLILM